MSWSSLHGHTIYSDGLHSPDEILQAAKDIGIKSIGITDHGTMAGTYLSRCCDCERVKVVSGLEAYHVDKEGNIYHITLLALNDVGFSNLCKANLYAWKNKRKFPLLDDNYLLDYKNWSGVCCLSGCPSSKFARYLMHGRVKEAKDWVRSLKSSFPDGFYVEIQGGSPIQDCYAESAMSIARSLGISVVSTSDYHYTYDNDKFVHDALMLSKGRKGIDSNVALCKCPETISGREGIENGNKLSDLVSYSKISMQKISVESSVDYLRDVVVRRAKELRLPDEYFKRIDYELSVIDKTDMGWYLATLYNLYSLIASKYPSAIIEVRGSSAASVVLWLLGVTSIDPIKHGLIFERFLSEKRKEIPDVDIDVQSSMRDDILDTISQRYRVAKIITSNRLDERGAKNAAIRAKQKGGIDVNPTLLVGKCYNTGVHASGVVISDTDFVVPLRYDKGYLVVEYENKYLPYVKFDLLGQKTFDVIHDVCSRENILYRDIIRHVECDSIDLYKSLCFAKEFGASGIFQVEGSMQSLFKRIRCRSIDDLTKLVAVYRPAVLASGYLDSILNNEKIDEEVSKYTIYGYPIFQEDLMRILVGFGICDITEAYSIVKLAAKKDEESLKLIEDKIRHRISGKRSDREIDNILTILRAFFGYGFNLAHARTYAIRAAVTAYLRYKYFKSFWEVALGRENDRLYLCSYLVFLSQFFTILPPMFNVDFSFCPDGNHPDYLYVGLSSYKNISYDGAIVICDVLKHRPTICDFLSSVIGKVNKREIESMIDSGLLSIYYGIGIDKVKEIFESVLYNSTHKRKKVGISRDYNFCYSCDMLNDYIYSGNYREISLLYTVSGLPFYLPCQFIGKFGEEFDYSTRRKTIFERLLLFELSSEKYILDYDGMVYKVKMVEDYPEYCNMIVDRKETKRKILLLDCVFDRMMRKVKCINRNYGGEV